MTYNRSLRRLDPSITDPTHLHGVGLHTVWIAGATGGIASWIVSAPSELIKCRTQLHVGTKTNSLTIFKHVWREHGPRGLYLAGAITSVRDSVGYGFYFASYELCRRLFAYQRTTSELDTAGIDVLVSGGVAGIITWASIYPLDVIKTRIQAEGWENKQGPRCQPSRNSSRELARSIFKSEGLVAFYRGLTVCSVRAFLVNAIQVSLSILPCSSHMLTSRSGTLMRSSWLSSLPLTPREMPPLQQKQGPRPTCEGIFCLPVAVSTYKASS